MNKFLTGLVICGLALVVGCQNSSTTGTTKTTKKDGSSVTKETKMEGTPDKKDDMKKDDIKKDDTKKDGATPPK